jgi:hypothetical protein
MVTELVFRFDLSRDRRKELLQPRNGHISGRATRPRRVRGTQASRFANSLHIALHAERLVGIRTRAHRSASQKKVFDIGRQQCAVGNIGCGPHPPVAAAPNPKSGLLGLKFKIDCVAVEVASGLAYRIVELLANHQVP